MLETFELLLLRKWYFPNSTIGDLFIQEQSDVVTRFEHECFTLEDHFPVPYVKRAGLTAIPEGRYEVLLTPSPRFGVEMPLLIGVPQFYGVRIHVGNRDKDTDGCLLVGLEKNLATHEILQSVAAYEKLYPKLKAAQGRSQRMFITIRRDA